MNKLKIPGGAPASEARCEFCGEIAVVYSCKTEVGPRWLCEYCAAGEQLDRVLDSVINRIEIPPMDVD